jgi:ribonuclease P protein subunit RPR2
MVRVARERIAELFALAEREAQVPGSRLPDRYVRLARRVGTRYNVRVPAEYRELYCRGCSSYWVEGRTVRTRLRGDRRVRTCLACGRLRRTRVRTTGAAAERLPMGSELIPRPEGALVGETDDELDDGMDDGEQGG